MLPSWLEPDRKDLERLLPRVNLPTKNEGNQRNKIITFKSIHEKKNQEKEK
jgi:hypothetical protein